MSPALWPSFIDSSQDGHLILSEQQEKVPLPSDKTSIHGSDQTCHIR